MVSRFLKSFTHRLLRQMKLSGHAELERQWKPGLRSAICWVAAMVGIAMAREKRRGVKCIVVLAAVLCVIGDC
jgi:hypothetical protein